MEYLLKQFNSLIMYAILVCCMLMQTLTATNLYGAHYETYDVMSDASVSEGEGGSWNLLNGRLSRPKCVDIPANLSLCRGLEYSRMRLPNLLEHDTLREVTQQSSSWKPLLGLRCHADTQLFLCSLFAPVCLDRLEAAVWPCRSLCEAVQSGCESHMVRYGFPWPEMLRCDKFPADNDLCIGVLTNNDASSCDACTRAYTFEGIVDNYCSADFVMKIGIRNTEPVDGIDLRINLKRKRKIYKVEGVRRRQLRQADLLLENGARCNCSHLASNSQYYLVTGNMRNGQMYVQYIHPYEKTSDLKKALKSMRAGSICEGGVQVLTANTENNEVSETSPNNAKAKSNNRNQISGPSTNHVSKRKNNRNNSVNIEDILQRPKSKTEGRRKNRNHNRLTTNSEGSSNFGDNRVAAGNRRNNGGQGRSNRGENNMSSGRRKNNARRKNNRRNN